MFFSIYNVNYSKSNKYKESKDFVISDSCQAFYSSYSAPRDKLNKFILGDRGHLSNYTPHRLALKMTIVIKSRTYSR